jgi:hypothetical protein
MLRSIAAVAAALALGSAHAQTAPTGFAGASATQQVQLLAPQLVPFAGSAGNFDSLVTGLTTGATVTLAAVAADGSLQIVTFTPGTALSVTDTARLLEAARQNLIVRGITAPTGPQLAASLLGGPVAGLSGTSAITGVLTGATQSPTPVTVRTDAGALQSGTSASNLSPAQLQTVRNALTSGIRTTLTTGTGAAAQNVAFIPTGRLSDADATLALQSATALLAQQGVLNPTAEQLRVALFGGTLLNSGNPVVVQGVLQPETRNASDSRILNTSASPAGSTSASPFLGTSNTPARAGTTAGAAAGATGTSGTTAAPLGRR